MGILKEIIPIYIVVIPFRPPSIDLILFIIGSGDLSMFVCNFPPRGLSMFVCNHLVL